MEFQALVGIAPWTFIAMVCNLLIQAALFKKFLFNPVKKIVAERQTKVNMAYASAEAAERAAKEKEAEYDELILSARSEANELIRNATATAQARGDEILERALKDANTMKVNAKVEIELEKKRALNEVKDTISDIAIEIASKVVEREIDITTHQTLVDKFIEKIGEEE